MGKMCQNCHSSFVITEDDRAFYKKIEVPEPTHCPSCRHQRRLSFRNEHHLFKRPCNLCKKNMISFHDMNVPFPVYCNDCWWSDKWDPLKYGKKYDFSRPFFEQFHDLLNTVPKTGMLHLNNENSEYNTLLAFSKNTYMSPGSYYVEDCYYVRKSQNCQDCLNSNALDHCELINESTNCKGCYQCHYLINCRNCNDCRYMADCIGCQDCFMCSGIANKKFHIKNKPYAKEEYKKILEEKLQQDTQDLLQEFLEFNVTIPKKYQNQINCENSSGDYLQNCKNATECYDCFDLEDCKYMIESVSVKDSMDLCMHDKDIELCYEVCSGGDRNTQLKFSYCTCTSVNCSYMYSCFFPTDCFGCDGIHSRQSHCILNKKYSKEEYEMLIPKIIGHMKKTGKYGEFFPIAISPFPYNTSVAQDFFPLTEQQAQEKGYKWKKEDPKNIHETPNSIINEILACKKCKKNYKIIAQELNLLKKLETVVSPLCPECRLKEILSLKNPRKLWKRLCSKCQKKIETTYSPGRPEKVYCEDCYVKTIT